ncbi:MAG: hypothetical protein H6704_01095 [Myxococcales bacterium]|nr:hypothetical protein [Myxococcales bacterium]
MPAPDGLTPTPATGLAPRVEERPTCPGCGVRRDPDGRRCAACNAAWDYRALVVGYTEDEARPRLLAYVARRSPAQISRERLMRRLARLPAVIQDGLTETQARRVRQEVEAFGVVARIELDAAAAPRPPGAGGRRLMVAALVALAVLGAGLWLVLRRPSVAEAVAPDAGPTAVAPPPPRRVGPEEVLGAVRWVPGPADAVTPVLFVDLDGWLLAPIERLGGADTLALGADEQAPEARVVRTEPRAGTALLKARLRPGFAASPTDAARLKAGDRVWVARRRGATAALEPRAVEASPFGWIRRAYLALDGPADLPDGTPVFTPDGGVAGVVDGAASRANARTLVVPINVMSEGEDALLAIVRPPRPPSPAFAAWRDAADRADRAARPDLYATIDDALLLSLTCPGPVCEAEVGLLAFGELPLGATGPFVAQFFGLDQSAATDEPAFGRDTQITLQAPWASRPLDDGPLLGSLAPADRARVLHAGLDDLRLLVAPVRVPRPAVAADAGFRLVLAGAGGRTSAATLVGARAPIPATPP